MHWLILENFRLADFANYLRRHSTPAMNTMLEYYDRKEKLTDLGHFRLGPNCFRDVALDWILLLKGEGSYQELVGHGITTRIQWDGTVSGLPGGWQDSVRRGLEDSIKGASLNALVGLFILVEKNFRKQQWAGLIAERMRLLAGFNHLQHLIIPLRPPLRYERDYASMPFEEFASLKREDGKPLDHWVRLHVNLGAKVLAISATSHQHAFALKDFHKILDPTPVESTGFRLVQQSDGWYNVFLHKEQEFALVNQGCVWVRHEPMDAR